MKRVVHPKCRSCGTDNPKFESERFGFRMCYRCLLDLSTWLWKHDCLLPNPLTQELFDGVFGGGSVPQDKSYTVTVLVEPNTARFFQLLRVPQPVEK